MDVKIKSVMMIEINIKAILSLTLTVLIVSLNPASADDSACSNFYSKLFELPHIKLAQNDNGFKSLGDGKWTQGCEIIFNSNESIVSGEKVYSTFQSFINNPFWTIEYKLSADGPGSSSVTIENNKNRCLVYWSQHAWIDEATGEHIQSSDIEMIIHCVSK